MPGKYDYLVDDQAPGADDLSASPPPPPVAPATGKYGDLVSGAGKYAGLTSAAGGGSEFLGKPPGYDPEYPEGNGLVGLTKKIYGEVGDAAKRSLSWAATPLGQLPAATPEREAFVGNLVRGASPLTAFMPQELDPAAYGAAQRGVEMATTPMTAILSPLGIAGRFGRLALAALLAKSGYSLSKVDAGILGEAIGSGDPDAVMRAAGRTGVDIGVLASALPWLAKYVAPKMAQPAPPVGRMTVTQEQPPLALPPAPPGTVPPTEPVPPPPEAPPETPPIVQPLAGEPGTGSFGGRTVQTGKPGGVGRQFYETQVPPRGAVIPGTTPQLTREAAMRAAAGLEPGGEPGPAVAPPPVAGPLAAFLARRAGIQPRPAPVATVEPGQGHDIFAPGTPAAEALAVKPGEALAGGPDWEPAGLDESDKAYFQEGLSNMIGRAPGQKYAPLVEQAAQEAPSAPAPAPAQVQPPEVPVAAAQPQPALLPSSPRPGEPPAAQAAPGPIPAGPGGAVPGVAPVNERPPAAPGGEGLAPAKYADLVRFAGPSEPEPSPSPVAKLPTPQVPSEPGTKYVLPSFATAGAAKGVEEPEAGARKSQLELLVADFQNKARIAGQLNRPNEQARFLKSAEKLSAQLEEEFPATGPERPEAGAPEEPLTVGDQVSRVSGTRLSGEIREIRKAGGRARARVFWHGEEGKPFDQGGPSEQYVDLDKLRRSTITPSAPAPPEAGLEPARQTSEGGVEEPQPAGARGAGEVGATPPARGESGAQGERRIRPVSGGGARPGGLDAGEPTPDVREPGPAGEGRELRAGPGRAAARKPVPKVQRSDEPGGQNTGRDHVVGDLDDLAPSGQIGRVRANIAAIKLFKEITAEARPATLEEQKDLARYSGWGSAPGLFNEYSSEWRELQTKVRDLIGESEWDSARRSTLNAHYTDPEIVQQMWGIARRLGFNGGRVLEPSMGSGYFFSLQPGDLAGRSSRTGVELDKVTGGIAKLLFPQSNVQVMGFQDYRAPGDFFDLAIGNVPFGDFGVYDKEVRNSRALKIHDFFFVKALAKTRPGGIVVFITSTGTLDKQDAAARARISEEADLVAALRLPSKAFQRSAGTEVVTDVVILRKRLEGEKPSDVAWMKREETPDPAGGEPIWVNEYFAAHPEQILGTLDRSGTMYRSAQVNVTKTPDFEDRLRAAIERLPKDVLSPPPERKAFAPRPPPAATKPGSFVVQEGRVYQSIEGELVPRDEEPATAKRIAAMVGVRDAVKEVFNAQLEGQKADAPRRELNRLYDAFVKKNGPLSAAVNARAFEDDPEAPVLLALEEWNPKEKKATKRAVFTQDTVRPYRKTEKVASAQEGVSVSLFETGGVDVPRIAKLWGKPKNAVEKALASEDLAFETPTDGWIYRDHYLSGNVRRKLAEAEAAAAADPRYQRNADALAKVQPPDVAQEEIDVKLGAPWVGPEDVKDFAGSLMDSSGDRFDVSYNAQSGKWFSNYASRGRYNVSSSTLATQVFGTQRMGFDKVLEYALNGMEPQVYDKDSQGNRQLNVEETALAASKARDVRERFKEWIWEDDDRAKRLHRFYNDNFNNIRLVEYRAPYEESDGGYVLPGMNPAVQLRPHQANAIWQTVVLGRALYAHEVGTGKSYTMVGAAMELRRLNLAKKPAIAVPTAIAQDFAKSARTLYPAANIFSMPEVKDAAHRKKLVSQIAVSDYDLVVLTHENVNMLPMRPETVRGYMQQELDELEEAIMASKAQDQSKGNRVVKELEKAKEKLHARLEEAIEGSKKDNAVFFEETGIDFLFVDEAHRYKSLPVYSSKQRIKGVPTSRSDRATAMLMRSRWLREFNGRGRGIVFATGTPVANTLAELYNLQKYLQDDELRERGVYSFDAWANTFAGTSTKLEQKATGEFTPTTRLAEFSNIPELLQSTRQVMDVRKADEVAQIIRPTKNRGAVVVPMSVEQKAYLGTIRERAAAIRGKRVDPKTDNFLKLSTDARLSAIDMRLVDPAGRDDPQNKVNAVVKRVLAVHSERPTVTQMIFSDQGVNPTKWGFSLYGELKRKLAGGGIPAAKIIDFTKLKDNERGAAIDRLDAGEALIGIGSSEKMGTGVNAQKRLYAQHNMDVPWLPAYVEQREGRARRQGNENKEILILNYTTEGSFDGLMWQAVDRKQAFINQVVSAKGSDQRSFRDEEGEEFSYAQIMAITMGNPDILRRFQLEQDINDLARLERGHKREQEQLKRTEATARTRAKEAQTRVDHLAKDAETAAAAPEEFQLSVAGKHFDQREEAAKDLDLTMRRFDQAAIHGGDQVVPNLGRFKGLELGYDRGPVVGSSRSVFSAGEEPMSILRSLEAVVRGLPTRTAYNRKDVQTAEKDASDAAARRGKPFAKAEELAKLKEEFKEIEAKLEKSKPEETPPETEPPAETPDEPRNPESGFVSLDLLVTPSQLIAKTAARTVGTREERYQALLGKDFGKRAYNLELLKGIAHEAGEADVSMLVAKQLTREDYWKWLAKIPYVGERGAAKISRLARSLPRIGAKFGSPRSERELLFDAAEGIKGLRDDGSPIFGTKIYERDKTGAPVLDANGDPLWAWRFEPGDAERNYQKLSDQGQKAVMWWVSEREYLKNAYDVVGGIEGYMHHYFEDGFFEGVRRLKWRYRKAGERKLRTEAAGHIRDFEHSVEKGIVDLYNEKVYNDFLEEFKNTVTRPVDPQDGPLPGWKVISKVEKTAGPRFVGQLAGGRQIPAELYDEFVRMVEGQATSRALATLAVDLGRYWRANVLAFSFTSTTTNLVSGAIQYATKVINDFWLGSLTGKFKPFVFDLVGLVDALRPSTIEQIPPEIFGAGSNIQTQFGAANTILHKLYNVELWQYGAVENYWKRVIAAAELRAAGRPVDREALLKDEKTLTEINEIIDRYAFNYHNEPPFITKFKRHPLGAFILPFPTYGYKLSRLYTHYLAAFNPFADINFGEPPGTPPPPPRKPGEPAPPPEGGGQMSNDEIRSRLARMLTLATILYLIYSMWPEEDEKTGRFVPGMPWDLDKTGRKKVGVTKLGKEIYLRVIKYPWMNFMEAVNIGGSFLRGETTPDNLNFLVDDFWSTGPLVAAALIVSGLSDRYDSAKPPGVRWGEMAKTWIPFFRLAEGWRQAGGGIPGIREGEPIPKIRPTTFWQALADAIPLPDALLAQAGITHGVRLSYRKRLVFDPMKTDEKHPMGRDVVKAEPVILDPSIEALKFWFGVNLKEIDVTQYGKFKKHILDGIVQQLHDAKTPDDVQRAMDRLSQVDRPRARQMERDVNEKEIRLTGKQLQYIERLRQQAKIQFAKEHEK